MPDEAHANTYLPKSYYRALISLSWLIICNSNICDAHLSKPFMSHAFSLPCPMVQLQRTSTYLHWLSLTSIENRSHISSPSWDYLKNHGMFDISSTVISSMSSLVLELWRSMSLFTVWRCPPEDLLIWRIFWKMTQFWTATGNRNHNKSIRQSQLIFWEEIQLELVQNYAAVCSTDKIPNRKVLKRA